MKCPKCSHPGMNVKDSRPYQDGETIRRRRKCPNCSHRITTYETIYDKHPDADHIYNFTFHAQKYQEALAFKRAVLGVTRHYSSWEAGSDS